MDWLANTSGKNLRNRTLPDRRKWLKVTSQEIARQRPIASLSYLPTSHVWRQDHNGFSRQDPGFIDRVVNKKADVMRV